MVFGYFSFAMHELGLSSKKPFKKSARVVGEVRHDSIEIVKATWEV